MLDELLTSGAYIPSSSLRRKRVLSGHLRCFSWVYDVTMPTVPPVFLDITLRHFFYHGDEQAEDDEKGV